VLVPADLSGVVCRDEMMKILLSLVIESEGTEILRAEWKGNSYQMSFSQKSNRPAADHVNSRQLKLVSGGDRGLSLSSINVENSAEQGIVAAFISSSLRNSNLIFAFVQCIRVPRPKAIILMISRIDNIRVTILEKS
jgi:hypothetical protein